MGDIKDYVEATATGIEVLGVLTVIVGMLLAFYKFIFNTGRENERSYKTLRQRLGRSILLGLEILVAGDIVSTVAFEPSMQRVLVLGMIVLIRTFLSMSIEVEIEGRFPWRNQSENGGNKKP